MEPVRIEAPLSLPPPPRPYRGFRQGADYHYSQRPLRKPSLSFRIPRTYRRTSRRPTTPYTANVSANEGSVAPTPTPAGDGAPSPAVPPLSHSYSPKPAAQTTIAGMFTPPPYQYGPASANSSSGSDRPRRTTKKSAATTPSRGTNTEPIRSRNPS